MPQGYYNWLKNKRLKNATMNVSLDENPDFKEDEHPRGNGGKFKVKPETIAKQDEILLKGKDDGRNKTDSDGRRNNPTDDFEAVCKESDGLPEDRRRQYRSGDLALSSREYDRIEKSLGGWLESSDRINGDRRGWTLKNPKTGKMENIRKVNGDVFRKLFSVCRSYLKGGDQVDLHDEEFYRDGGFGIVNENGTAGFYITKDGDAVSGYSLQAFEKQNGTPKKTRGGGFFPTIAPLMRKYAKTTDCFCTKLQNLPEYYKKVFGFKIASTLDFNYDILASDRGKEYADWFVKTYGESPVTFMVMTDDEVETKHFPKDDWDGAYGYQQEIASKTTRPRV